MLIDERTHNNVEHAIFLLSVFFILMGFFSFSFIYSIIKETYNISISNNSFKLIRPFSLNEKTILKENIKGYSKSQIKYGIYIGNSLFNTNSIVVYFDNSKPFELVKYNYMNFKQIENQLKELNVPYLGFEEYQTGLFFRKYKF